MKPKGYWKDINNQRAFFDEMASKHNLHNPRDWAAVSWETLLKEGGYFVSQYYKGSLLKGKLII
jgi:hypothetical protein